MRAVSCIVAWSALESKALGRHHRQQATNSLDASPFQAVLLRLQALRDNGGDHVDDLSCNFLLVRAVQFDVVFEFGLGSASSQVCDATVFKGEGEVLARGGSG